MRSGTALARPANTPLVLRSAPLPPDLDPLLLWRVAPEAQRFFWERPAGGEAIAAVGATATIRAEGPARFATIAREAAALGLPPQALLVGGFAFDPDHRPAGAWETFPAAAWAVPRLAIVRARRGARLLTTDDSDPAATARELARARRLPPAATHHYDVAPLGDPAAWRAAVETTLADIAAGRLEKLVLARSCRVAADAAFDPLLVLERLRRRYPGCTVFAVAHGARTFAGASPERLARVDGAMVRTEALAGTAARGTSPAADRALARALLASPKERTEHAIVVDDVRARLDPLCVRLRTGRGPRLVRTEAVQHLATPLAGRLRPGVGLLDVVAALHPTPAVAGAPRPAALAAIAAREDFARGWYTGGVGWIGPAGGEMTVALRAALLDGSRALLHAGCGIVAGSTWEAELEETQLKLRPLLGALLDV